MKADFKKAVEKLKAKRLTVTFAESCTGGLMAKCITDVPGASAVFPGGAVTYCNEIKTKVLGVCEKTLSEYTEVSRQTAREMAKGAASLFGADIAVSATGYAGPGGGTEKDPVGTVYTGVYAGGKTFSYKLYYPGMTREEIRGAVACFAAYIIECEADRL